MYAIRSYYGEISLLDAGPKLLDLLARVEVVHFPLIMDHKYAQESGTDTLMLPDADIGVVSGGVASAEQLALLHAMRSSCRTLVALGTCATHGGIPAMRNQWTVRSYNFV